MEGCIMYANESYNEVINERSSDSNGIIASWIVLSVIFAIVVLL